MTAAQEQKVLEKWVDACDDFSIAANRQAMIQFIELKANADPSSQVTLFLPSVDPRRGFRLY
jgi:hypothetical protein